MTKINASIEHPVLLWNYKGVNYATDKVIVRHSDTLRKEERKFWSSIIKPSPKGRLTKYNHRSQVCRKKEIFWSYKLLPMIHNNLKVSVRLKPFYRTLVDRFI